MKKLSYWLPVLLWMGVIFTFSSFQAVQAAEVHWVDFVIKKSAHVVEYAILWGLTFRALLNTSHLGKTKAGLVSLLMVVIYATTDEYHQTWIPSRTGRARDVLIDTTGASLAFVWFNRGWIAKLKRKAIEI